MDNHSPRRWSYRAFLDRILAYPALVIAIMVAVTAVFATQIPRLQFSTSVYDLVIEDLPETAVYKQYKSVFGSDEIIRVVIRAEDVFDPATFRYVELLANKAESIDGVRRVISLPGVKKAVDISGDWSLDKFRDVVGPVDLFRRNLVSEDGKTTVLTLLLSVDADSQKVIAAVDDLIAAAPKTLSLYQIGMPLVSQALELFTQRDFFRLPPITFGLIALILLFLFRTVSGVLLPLLSVGGAIIWTFGLMAVTGISLSILTMIVPVFLIAVGTAYCLHIMSEHAHNRKQASTPDDAVRKTFAEVTFPTVLAVSTTVIGLGSLLLNHIPAIREFAWFSCFGMISLTILVLTLMPAMLHYVPANQKIEVAPRDPKRGIMDRFIDVIIDINLNRQKITYTVIGVLSVVCIIGIFRIRVETNPLEYFKPDTPVSRHFHDIYQDLSGSFPINVTIASKEEYFFEKNENLALIARLQKYLETLPGVDKVITFNDYLKLVKYASNRFEKEKYAPPEADWESRMLINSYRMMLGDDMFTRFMNQEMNQTSILLLTHLSGSAEFLETRQKIREHIRRHFPPDLEYRVTGFGVVISATSRLLTSGQVKSLSLTMIVVFGIMFALFLSKKVGLIAIIPNIFPIIVNFGLMGWLGIDLSMFTSLVASIAIGLAVDDTIHYLVRYNREFRKDLNDRRALTSTMRQIARPIMFTTVTISIGFSILALSSFQATAIFGIMMVITMVSALVGDLILLPSLLLHVELVTLWDLVRLKLGREPRYGIPLFRGLSHAQVHYIIMAGTLTQVEAGEVLFRKGDPSDSMYALVSGAMDVVDHDVVEAEGGSIEMRKTISHLKAGDVIGEMGLLRRAPRSATIIASTPCELLCINLKMIKRLQWLYPPAAHRFFFNLMTILCDRLENATHCLLEGNAYDDLTGLCNYNSFITSLDIETYRSNRYQSDLSLCLVRCYREADINAGEPVDVDDNTVLMMSELLGRHLRRCDVLGRMDAATFALMMPQTPLTQAKIICSRLESLIKTDMPESQNGLTVSFGLVGLDEGNADSGDELYRRAVERLVTSPLTR